MNQKQQIIFLETSIQIQRVLSTTNNDVGIETVLKNPVVKYEYGRQFLDMQISTGLWRLFWQNVAPIHDLIVCDLIQNGIVQQQDESFTVADSCRKETATCHLPDFLAQHQPELCAIHDYLTAHPNAVKDQSRVERLLTTVIEDPRAALGQSNCWPLGDVIIALQVPENAALWTLDSDFAPLLTALSRRLYVAE